MLSVKRHAQTSEHEEAQWQPTAFRLSHFQQMMSAWDAIHPYNAVHVVSLAGRADAPALQEAVRRACRAVGVGKLAVDTRAGTYRYLPFEDITVRQRPAGCDAGHALCAVISEEMNGAFPTGPHVPLRWTVFDDALNNEHFVLLVYHHVAADAYSIQALLALVLHHYLDLQLPGDYPGLRVSMPQGGNRLCLGSHRLGHPGALTRAVGQYFKLRRAHRWHEDRSGRNETGFVLRSVPSGMLDRLRAVCRAEGAGLNDVFLAALTTALAQRTPARRTHRRRRKIAVGTVLSHRTRAGGDLSGFFGVCLSDAALLVDRPDAGIRGVLAQIVPQTRCLKAIAEPIEPAWRFLFVKYLWPALRIPHSVASYRKVFPLCAGVSTVLLDMARFGETAGRIRRYVRACPPGPAMPMLLSPTIAAGRLELGLVYRVAAVTETQAHELLDSLVDALGDLIR
jgi:hypothetical protein